MTGQRAGPMPEQAEVLAAIRALPEIYRNVLVATYLAGLTYSEAAEAFGVKRGTVMSHVFRARRRSSARSAECRRRRRSRGLRAGGSAGRGVVRTNCAWRECQVCAGRSGGLGVGGEWRHARARA